jgi:hypothetical protein
MGQHGSEELHIFARMGQDASGVISGGTKRQLAVDNALAAVRRPVASHPATTLGNPSVRLVY